ncbi:CidA/LrgA family protein [Craterilacuibacter sp.]|uniref:CidA/LrgA family protein n=1 Tax=Craterilacuibacter sp. TaxID=2870909 RepID=UPI003F675FC4
MLLSLWWWCAEGLCRRWLPAIPGGVLGMVLLLLALQYRLLPIAWVEHGANYLLAEMLLFFIPAVVAVVKFSALFEQAGLRIAAVIVLSTACVMLVTAFAVDRCDRFLRFRRIRMHRHGEALCSR